MNENRIMISQYYIHDTRIFEFYFLLRVLVIYKLKRIKIHRQELEKELIHRLTMLNNKLEMPNINGLRNMFITLNQLGLIVNNIPTERGFILANLDYSDFALQFFEYLRPYFEVLLGILEKNSDLEQSKIFDLISQKYGGKEVIWLAEFQKKDRGKNTRYISSYLNILRDGYGVLDFAPRSSNRKILFNPLQTNERAFKEHIEKFSKYNDYKEIFERILREI
ncbi:hypothetical protein DMC01_05220 [Campylobacter troglodytis]|nr:hypothetical protein DMC01_05220 [Campylobacter troglodytis]